MDCGALHSSHSLLSSAQQQALLARSNNGELAPSVVGNCSLPTHLHSNQLATLTHTANNSLASNHGLFGQLMSSLAHKSITGSSLGDPTCSNVELSALLPSQLEGGYGDLHSTDPYAASSTISAPGMVNSFDPLCKRSSRRTNADKNGPGNGGSIILKQYPLRCVRFLDELGEGAFGKVYKGELRLRDQHTDDSIDASGEGHLDSSVIPIAIKTLKESASNRVRVDFQREAELMADLQHPNIVCLLGVCFQSDPLCMLFEFMSEGDLHQFLLSHSTLLNEGIANAITNTGIIPNSLSTGAQSNSSGSSSLVYSDNGRNSIPSRVLNLNDFLHISTQIAAGKCSQKSVGLPNPIIFFY